MMRKASGLFSKSKDLRPDLKAILGLFEIQTQKVVSHLANY